MAAIFISIFAILKSFKESDLKKKITLLFRCKSSDGSGTTRNLVFGLSAVKKWWLYKCKLNKAFLHFWQNLWHIWWFSIVKHAEGTAKLWNYHQICQKMWQKTEEKSSSTACLKPFFVWFRVPENPILNTRFITIHEGLNSHTA